MNRYTDNITTPKCDPRPADLHFPMALERAGGLVLTS